MKDWNGAVLTLMFVPFMMPVVFKAGTFIRQPPRGFQSVMALGWIALALSNDVSDNQSQGRSVLCCWSAGSCAVSAFHLVWLDLLEFGASLSGPQLSLIPDAQITPLNAFACEMVFANAVMSGVSRVLRHVGDQFVEHPSLAE